MKFFKDKHNNVFAFEADGSQDHIIPENLVAITSDEAETITKPAQTIEEIKALAYAAIDAQAGRTRTKYITDVAGQSETYLLKADNARAYKSAGYPSANINTYPMVRAEARAIYGTVPTPAQYQLACDYILGTQDTWLQIAADIEEHRRTGKEAVKAATDAAGVNFSLDAVIATLQTL